MPARPGVYIFRDARGEVIYVGGAGGVGHRPSGGALDIVLLRSQDRPQKDR